MKAKRPLLVLGAALWIGVAGVGLYAVAAHGAAPGRPPATPEHLSTTLRTPGRATLVMATHPHCPCTRASLRELARVLSKSPDAVDVVILLSGARQRDRIAEELRAMAAGLPGSPRVIDDFGGVEAARLGAHTSGTVVFFDRTGTLRFSGGITASRGHEGGSAGADAVSALLLEESRREPRRSASDLTAAPVYGCKIFEEETKRR